MIRLFTFALILSFLPLCALAQPVLTAPTAENNEPVPLVITADEALEWDRANLTFTASGNALARQGTVSLAGERLRADYRDTQGSNFDIYHIHADQNVVIRSDDSYVYGDQADYDLERDVALVTGENLKLEAPDHTLTALQRFEYQPKRGFFEALGAARLEMRNVQGEINILEADRITANFVDDGDGSRVLQRLNAYGNVQITTPQEVLTADRGVYFAQRRFAQVFENVEIRRGPNILQGQEADIDLNTQISRMKGGGAAGPDGRVRGVFFPGSTKN